MRPMNQLEAEILELGVLFRLTSVFGFDCCVLDQAGVPTTCPGNTIDFHNGVTDSSRHGLILRGVFFDNG